jgi:hypothetical protein
LESQNQSQIQVVEVADLVENSQHQSAIDLSGSVKRASDIGIQVIKYLQAKYTRLNLHKTALISHIDVPRSLNFQCLNCFSFYKSKPIFDKSNSLIGRSGKCNSCGTIHFSVSVIGDLEVKS